MCDWVEYMHKVCVCMVTVFIPKQSGKWNSRNEFIDPHSQGERGSKVGMKTRFQLTETALDSQLLHLCRISHSEHKVGVGFYDNGDILVTLITQITLPRNLCQILTVVKCKCSTARDRSFQTTSGVHSSQTRIIRRAVKSEVFRSLTKLLNKTTPCFSIFPIICSSTSIHANS